MTQGINRYRANLRHYEFLLFEQFGISSFLNKAPYPDWGEDEVKAVLEAAFDWCCDEIGTINAEGDRVGCRIEDGRVITPKGYTKAWKSLYEAGWRSIAVEEEWGGQQGPYCLQMALEEFMSGANCAFAMYPGLTQGVFDVVQHFGTDEQKKKYCRALSDGSWSGTMCLTEPQAGSDVGAATTKALPAENGMWKIEGTKMFISGGDNDLSSNVVHLVLARTPDSPPGTKGLSLFLVPRDRLDGSGSNNVVVGGIEHKMGINGSATCLLNFGEGGDCYGELIGGEHQGMRRMFRMMNFARISVGLQGLSVASSAYLNALDYTRERKQGTSIKDFKDPTAKKVAIIEHPNVRRMLLDMKSKVEGIRALAVKLTTHLDRRNALQGKDEEEANYHQGQVELLVPLLKAYGSDTGYEVCTTAIQTFGGAGYLKDHPVEQYARDAKIFSIYEGTNHIQALDLVARKLGQKGGANFQAFLKDMGTFIAKNSDGPLKEQIAILKDCSDTLTKCAMQFLQWFQGGDMDLVPLAANRFLAMMAETVVGWMLLEGAVIALNSSEGKDKDFYDGVVASAKFFAINTLKLVPAKGIQVLDGDRTCVDLADAAFQ